VLERALAQEMTGHLGYEKHDPAGRGSGNSRPVHNQMVPHTIGCEPGLIIYKIYNGYWFLGRPTVEELRTDLRTVLRKSHWDWDPSDPRSAPTGSGSKSAASRRPNSAGLPKVTARGTGSGT
jgi:hypothetical protein